MRPSKLPLSSSRRAAPRMSVTAPRALAQARHVLARRHQFRKCDRPVRALPVHRTIRAGMQIDAGFDDLELLDVRERLRHGPVGGEQSPGFLQHGPVEPGEFQLQRFARAASGLQLPSAETTAGCACRRKLLESPRRRCASRESASPRRTAPAAATGGRERGVASVPACDGSKRSVSSRASQWICAASCSRRAPSAWRVSSSLATRALNPPRVRIAHSPESKLTSRNSPAVGRQSLRGIGQRLARLRWQQRRDELCGHERQTLRPQGRALDLRRARPAAPRAHVSAGARSRRAPRVSCRSVKSSSKSCPSRASVPFRLT